jgi:hypothetical protein
MVPGLSRFSPANSQLALARHLPVVERGGHRVIGFVHDGTVDGDVVDCYTGDSVLHDPQRRIRLELLLQEFDIGLLQRCSS